MSSIGFYDRNAEDFFQRTLNADMALGYAAFLALVPPGGHILDAGCGSGRDSLAFLKLGFEVTAMEASETLATLARAHTGLPIEVLTFDQITWTDTFDGVWASASLLHVPRVDLPNAIGRLRDALVPRGILWMSFKYGTEERQVGDLRFTDMDEDGARLVTTISDLNLISMQDSADLRPDRPGERWLSIMCRKSA